MASTLKWLVTYDVDDCSEFTQPDAVVSHMKGWLRHWPVLLFVLLEPFFALQGPSFHYLLKI